MFKKGRPGRDPERIPALIGKIEEYWSRKVPDWRFGQLTFNFLTWVAKKTQRDYFYIEDDQMSELLDEFFEGIVNMNNKNKDYKTFLETFIPSREMREYLLGVGLGDRTKAEIVKYALVPLEIKLAWLEGEDRQAVQNAIIELYSVRQGEFFCLIDEWYDPEIFNQKDSFACPVPSLEKAIEYIRQEDKETGDIRSDKDPINECIWYTLEKWRHVIGEGYQRIYTYYVVDRQVVYFAREDQRYRMPSRSRHLNLPVPFNPGDILTVDCRPFAPPVHAVLLEKGDNVDCCCLQILYRDIYTGKWTTCALKHGLMLEAVEDGGYQPFSSPLYRLERFEGPLPKNESHMSRVSKFIDGDDGKGRALWQKLNLNKSEEENDSEELSKLAELIKRRWLK